jgi:exonuclease III
VHGFQDDHILVTPDLAPKVSSSLALDNSETRRLSDRIPVVTALSIGAGVTPA